MEARDPPAPAAPRIEITLRRQGSAPTWQAEVVFEGRTAHFTSLLALIGWLARLELQGGGIR